MSEPTSVLTFQDLILETARKARVAYYGENGDEKAQIPNTAYELDECKRHVNNAIRMFIHDAPQPHGWRWTRPTASVSIWNSIAADSTQTVVSAGYDTVTDKTLITANTDSFYESMEEKEITVTDVDTYTISDYVSATQIKVYGDATAIGTAGTTWSITSDGNFTLPRTFQGMYTGQITYASGTDQGIGIEWKSEALIRQWRANITDDSGDPYWAAVRVMSSGTPRRRWELMVYPTPDEVLTVEFPYQVHFDSLVNLDDVSPAPFCHDETIKAACLAIVEKDGESQTGADWEYYRQVCLPQSYMQDALSAPQKLESQNRSAQSGSIQYFRDVLYQRPTVTFNG